MLQVNLGSCSIDRIHCVGEFYRDPLRIHALTTCPCRSWLQLAELFLFQAFKGLHICKSVTAVPDDLEGPSSS